MAEDRSLRQFLQLLKSAGVTHLPLVTLPPPKAKRSVKPSGRTAQTSSTPTSAPRKMVAETGLAPPKLPETLAILQQDFDTPEAKSKALCQLADLVAGCQRCTELAESRQQTVFGTGNPDANIMFIGEAPGADEDRQGEPFVGAAGQLLNKIIEACGLKREDVYICNVLRCRPPGNRNPQPQEAANCREFLDAQIAIVQPGYIVCWGTVAAQNLLNEQRAVGRLRGQFLQYGDAKVLCTYHPSYLLRNPAAKKQVWEDMKFLMKDLGIDLE
jgi:uracil-DNA glycosylase family 4